MLWQLKGSLLPPWAPPGIIEKHAVAAGRLTLPPLAPLGPLKNILWQLKGSLCPPWIPLGPLKNMLWQLKGSLLPPWPPLGPLKNMLWQLKGLLLPPGLPGTIEKHAVAAERLTLPPWQSQKGLRHQEYSDDLIPARTSLHIIGAVRSHVQDKTT